MPSGLASVMTWVDAGVVTFLPPMWEIVNSIEAFPAATLRGTTVVYFFLTKDIAIRYIFLPPRAPAERGLRLKVRLRRLTTRLPVNLFTINLIITSLLVHRDILFYFFFLIYAEYVESSLYIGEAIRVDFFGVFVTATDNDRLQHNACLKLDLVLESSITHLVQILYVDLRSSELVYQ